MPDSETTITTSTDNEPEQSPSVVVAGGTTDQSTIQHEGRLTQLEERYGALGSQVNGLGERVNGVESTVGSLSETVKSGFDGLNQTLSGLASQIGEGTKNVVETVSEPVKEIVDSAPLSKSHWFFDKWGQAS